MQVLLKRIILQLVIQIAIPLILSTANTKRLVIKGDGDIGINVDNPGSRLAIYDADGNNLLLASHNFSGEARIGFTGNTGYWCWK